MSISQDVINNGWKQSYINAQTGTVQARPKSMVLERLLAGSTNGRFRVLGEVKRRFNTKDPNKENFTVTVAKIKRRAYGADSDFSDACTPTTSPQMLARAYTLRRFVQDKITLNEDDFACLMADNTTLAQSQFDSFWAGLHEKFSAAVESLIYSPEYIGKLPALNTFGAPRAYADLAALRADGITLNPRAELDLMQDMEASGAGNYFMVGGTRLAAYQLAKRIASPALAGYDPSKIATIEGQGAIVSNMLAGSPYIAGLGLTNPVLVIEDGALQIVSAPIHPLGAPRVGSGQRFWSVEHPNLRGVYVNIIETISDVCDPNGRLITTWSGTILFDIIGEMSCDADGNIWSDGEAMKGVYLYNLTCSDDTLCDAPNRIAALPNFAKDYNKNCDVDMVCAADATCSITLSQGYLPDPETGRLLMILTANATASAGGTPATLFEWSVNGNVLPETTSIISIDTALLADGDVIKVVGMDSLACSNETSLVVENLQQNCGTLTANFDNAFYLDGDTINLGNVNQNSAKTVDITFAAVGYAINVLSITSTGDVVSTANVPAVPVTLAAGGAGVVTTVTLKTTTLGANQAIVTVSHEGCDGEFVLQINFDVI